MYKKANKTWIKFEVIENVLQIQIYMEYLV